MISPSAQLDSLPKADGSATYSYNGYTIVGSVNGPIEVQRRDELPEEATLEIHIRPAIGIGGVRERHLESLLHATLGAIILTQTHPRTLIQITLQITAAPTETTCTSQAPHYTSYLSPLPALLQTALLAILSASIPLSATCTSTILAVGQAKDLIVDPSPAELRRATSVHVLTFSSNGELLLAQSEGEFDWDTWEAVYGDAERICWGSGKDETDAGGDVRMRNGDEVEDHEGESRAGLGGALRDVVREKVLRDLRWREEVK